MLLKLGLVLCGVVAKYAVSASKTPLLLSHSSEAAVKEEDKLHLLIYETETSADSPAFNLLRQAEHLDSVEAQIFGSGSVFDGYGSKYSAVYPLLEIIDPNAVVVISDGRDVLLNSPSRSADDDSIVHAFRAEYERLTQQKSGAVVVSAEAQCCVSALTHITPGDLFHNDGSRKAYACASGTEGCLWNGDDSARPWESFMAEAALTRTESAEYDDVYLNAGLIAGKAKDLIDLIDALKIDESEDDQAVLTDYMYHNGDKIVLDYGQSIFGNNRGGAMGDEQEGCVFSVQEETSSQQLTHEKTGTSPLFVHSPGGFTKCHDKLATQLGLDAVALTARRRLGKKKKDCNYNSCR